MGFWVDMKARECGSQGSVIQGTVSHREAGASFRLPLEEQKDVGNMRLIPYLEGDLFIQIAEFFFFSFLQPHLRYMEVPTPRVESKLQLVESIYTTATATQI